MTTRFSKQKLAEGQGKKAKGGLISGLLSRKHSKVGDVSKGDPMVTPLAYSLAKRLASPTSSLEVIASAREETKKKKKKKVAGKSFLLSFWDDANVAALEAHKALSMDDLSPRPVKLCRLIFRS